MAYNYFRGPTYALDLDMCLPKIPITNSVAKEKNSACWKLTVNKSSISESRLIQDTKSVYAKVELTSQGSVYFQ